MYVDPQEKLQPVDGERVAHALIATYRCICDPARWSIEVYAFDRDGQPLGSPNDIKTNGARFSLLGALELASSDLDVHAAACSALSEVRDTAGLRVNLMSLGRAEGHVRVLKLLDAAIRLARTRAWPRHRRVALPDRAPTEEEYGDLCLEHQLIDECFFGTVHDRGGQFEATRSMSAAMEARRSAIGEYLKRHQASLTAIESAITGRERRAARAERTRARKRRLTGPLRRAHAGAATLAGSARRWQHSRSTGEDIPF